MKYQKASYADGTFTIHCPYCEREIGLTEEELGQINTQMEGHCPCPVEECKQDIEFPNAEEAVELKAPTSSAAPVPAAQEVASAPASEPASAQAAPESALTPAPEPVPAPAPAPPPQTNPAANPTSFPVSAPKPETPLNPPTPQTQSKDKGDDFAFGFHGSKGASLEREAASTHRISMKTILHSDCVKDKEDLFDETVSKFLNELGEDCLMGVHPVQYAVDEKKGTDFGVMILYKLPLDAD